ncbi:MAG: hypothetical protein WCI11_01315 [Candidatus Methylumidiphilus sp.]
MDQQLKQRLIGVTIVVALVVIFVPMLFEKSDDKGKFSSTGIPSIPDDVMEKNIELPKTAEELAPKEDEEKKPVESGYRIVPMNDEPPPKPKLADESAAKAKPGREVDLDKPVVSDEGGEDPPGPEKSDRKVRRVIQPAETVRLAPVTKLGAERPGAMVNKHPAQPKTVPVTKKIKTVPPKLAHPATEPDADLDVREEPVPAHVKAENQVSKKSKTSPVTPPRQGDGIAERKPAAIKKPETAKTPVTHPSPPKEYKPKPYAPPPETDRDLGDEPVPAPVKPETQQVRPKSAVGASPRPAGVPTNSQAAAKKPNSVKPPVPVRPGVKAEKPESQPVINPQPKPKASKPVPTPTPPAKPADPEKVKPQTMAPGGSFFQAGGVSHLPGRS